MNDQVVTEITRRAMATQFGVVLPGENRAAVEAAIDVLEELEGIEAALSVYRPGSDISRINAMSGQGPVKVCSDVIKVLQRSLEIWQLTAGAFDVTAGPLVECWGFSKRRGKKPTDQEIAAALARIGSDQLQLDPVQRTAFLRRPAMAINLGGIGKGFALDRLAGALQARGLKDFLIHGGRSSVLARGTDGSAAEAGWTVAIAHPLRPDQRIGQIRLRDAALATSGSGKQFFHHRGQRLGHVLDPRLGRPAGDMLAITVVAPNATDADALATACFVEGLAATRAHLQRRGDGPDETAAGAQWPTAGAAVIAGDRQGEVQLVELGELGLLPR